MGMRLADHLKNMVNRAGDIQEELVHRGVDSQRRAGWRTAARDSVRGRRRRSSSTTAARARQQGPRSRGYDPSRARAWRLAALRGHIPHRLSAPAGSSSHGYRGVQPRFAIKPGASATTISRAQDVERVDRWARTAADRISRRRYLCGQLTLGHHGVLASRRSPDSDLPGAREARRILQPSPSPPTESYTCERDGDMLGSQGGPKDELLRRNRWAE